MKKEKKREKIRIDWLDILPREQIGYWYESLQMTLNRQSTIAVEFVEGDEINSMWKINPISFIVLVLIGD